VAEQSTNGGDARSEAGVSAAQQAWTIQPGHTEAEFRAPT